MQIWFLRSGFHGLLELGNGFRSPTQAVQSFSRKHMHRRGIWIVLLDLSKLFERTIEPFRPQAALRQHLPQLDIAWIGFRCQLKMLRGLRKPLRSVVAQAKQCVRLHAIRLGSQSGVERGYSRLKMALLEFRQTEVQLDSGELGLQS